MKDLNEYFDEAKTKLDIESDGKLGARYGLSRQKISDLRKHRYKLPDDVALALSQDLGIEIGELIAAENFAHAKSEEQKRKWENFYKRLGGVAASLAVISFTALPYLDKASTLYIMLNRMANRFRIKNIKFA